MASSTSSSPTVSLKDLISGKNWSEVLKRLETEQGRREAGTPDRLGYFPIHNACDYIRNAPLEVVQALIEALPNGASTPTMDGYLPIHFACMNESQVVLALIEAFPDGASMPTKNGNLPIHWACTREPPVELTRALIEAYPDGASTPNERGDLPIHILLYARESPLATIRELLQAYPNGAIMPDKEGRSPLHRVCRDGAFTLHNADEVWDKVTIIAQAAYSASIGGERFIPNPTLCSIIGGGGADPGLISGILEYRPEEANARDHRGGAPLHIASATAGVGPDVIDKLLESELVMETAGRPDDEGRLPLHLAAERGLGHEGVQSIMEAQRRAIGTTDSTTRLSPFMMAAIGGNCSVDTVYSLLREVPDKIGQCIGTVDADVN